jgi:hypothetical protein
MGFPDSDFANLIRDNEYYKELIQRQQRVEDGYAELYDLYHRQRYSALIALADQAEENYPDHPKLPKFRYWRALALARQGNTSDAITLLQSIVSTAPQNDSIVPIAQAQLNLIRNSNNFSDEKSEEITSADEQRVKQPEKKVNTETPNAENDELPSEALIYRYRENQQHYVVIIVNDRTVKATELQYRLADFNSQYYANNGYRANASLFTDTTQIITVHRFTNADEALGYYRHLSSSESPLQQYAPTDYTHFIISTQNYATFYNRKNIQAYLAFFRKYYNK